MVQAVGTASRRLDALELEASVPLATDSVPTPRRPDLTAGEARELGWRLQREQEARR